MTATNPGINLGPLTTTFEYPSSCSVAIKACLGCDFGWQAQTCSDNRYNGQGVQDNSDCWPPRANPDIQTPIQFDGWGYYSPGLYCPEGYHSACSSTAGNTGGFRFQFPPGDAQTAVGCCPDGFTCANDGRQTCVTTYTTGSFPAVQCRSGTSNGFSYQTVPATTTSRVSAGVLVTVIPSYTIHAPMIQLVHRTEDLPVTTTTSTSISSSTSSSLSISSDSSLATGAIVGIAVGAALIIIGIIGIAIGLLYRKRRKTSEGQPLLAPNVHLGPGKGPVSVTVSMDGIREMMGTPKSELPSHNMLPAEVDGSRFRGELAAAELDRTRFRGELE